MRTLTFDAYEFDTPDGEEGLEISVAAKDERAFANVSAFASKVWGIEATGKLSSPVAFAEDIGPGNVRAYLQRYAGVRLPTPCSWPTYVLSNEWNDFDAILAGPANFVRYHWRTSA